MRPRLLTVRAAAVPPAAVCVGDRAYGLDLMPAGAFGAAGEQEKGRRRGSGSRCPPRRSAVPARCEVTLTLTRPGPGDHAQVRMWPPETGRNGRFQAARGSAYAAGDYGAGLPPRSGAATPPRRLRRHRHP